MENNFLFDLIASLKKTQSQKQVREDIKALGEFKLPLIGTLNKAKTRSQIKQDLSSLNGSVNLTGKVDNKRIAASMKQATVQAQKQAKPVEISFSVKKEKLMNDIKLLAQQNSKLFKNSDMSIKYNSLLDEASMARNTVELSALRTQLGSLRSELKVTGNAGLTFGDSLKKSLSKVMGLFGNFNVVMQFKQQLRNAWTEAQELDKSLTDLSRVNEGITRSGFPDYLDRVISKTKQLAVATKDYIDSVTTFSRAGYNLADSETLADAAIQLEKVGDMSAVDASKALLAGLQGYDEIDGYGMDQLIEKAQALNDKIDIIGNTASISQKEVAQGIQAVGSVMNDANTSVDEFIALLGAGNRAVQDSDKVALAIRTSALRIRGCTAELEEMGEETDSVVESTSKLAEKIEGLTNINGSGGVKILEADEETFRSIYDIYNDISKVYSQMSDKDASALLDLIAGKNRSNQISAILQNMSEANVLLESSLNAAGTASAEYEIYLNSAEAASERFGVAMTEAYSSIIGGETVKGLTNAGTAVLDFANSWNVLEGTVRGFLTLGILKGVTALTVAFRNSALQISNYGSALSAVKQIGVHAQDTEKYAEAMGTLKSSCINLTDVQLKQVLVNRNLSESQLLEILQIKSLTKEQREARLAQLGLIQTTEEQTVAQGAATASTFSLSAAVKGLGASIKTAFMANPIGMTILAASVAVGVITSAMSKYRESLEDANEVTKEAVENFESVTSEVTSLEDKISELNNQINELDPITDAEDIENLKLETEELNTQLAILKEKQRIAGADADKAAQKSLGMTEASRYKTEERESAYGGIESGAAYVTKDEELLNAIEAYEEYKSKVDEANDALAHMAETGDYTQREWDAQEQTVSKYSEKMEDARTHANELASAISEQKQGLNGNTESSQQLLTVIDGTIEKYNEWLDGINGTTAALEEQAVAGEHAASKVVTPVSFDQAWGDTFTSENDAVKELSENLLGLAEKGRLTKEAFELADSNAGAYFKNLGISADEAVDKINKLVDESSQLSSMSKAISQMSEALGAKKENGFVGADTLSGFDVEIKGLDSWDRFQSVLGSTTSSYQECKDAAMALANEWMNSGNFLSQLTEQNRAYYQTQLESMGVANAEEVVMYQLALSKEAARIATLNLADMTQAAMYSLFGEAESAGITQAEIYRLAAAEIAYNSTGLDTQGKIDQLGNLAKAYGDTATAAMAAAAADRVANGHGDLETIMSDMMAQVGRAAENSVKIDFSGIGKRAKAASKAAKAEKEEADIMAELNSEMDKLQSAYKSLCDIKDTYNKYGKITVDQYQELTSMGFNFLAQLVDENGQLGLNAGAFEKLASAKLQEMQIQMARNATDTINGLKTEAEAVEYLTYANENLRDAALGAAEAQLYAAQAAAKGKKREAADLIVKGYEASKQLAGNTDFFFEIPKEEKEKKEKEDKTDKLLEAYNKEKALLEHMLSMDQISKSEYYDRLMKLVHEYFDGDEEHQDQIWDVEEGYHQYLESIKETYNWIEIFLENLAKKSNALIDKASKFISWSKKNAMINRAVKATDKQITGQTNAYAYYAEKARKVGLNNAYIDKIQNGTLTMEDMQNEKLSGKIEKYQEWYDRMVACEDAINELYDQERDLIRQKLDNVLDYYSDLDSYMSSVVSKMDSFISLMDDMGKRSSLTDLLEQFAAVNEQVAYFQSQTTTGKKENDKDYFDSSQKVEAAKKEDTDKLIGELTADKDQTATGVQDTGTYKKLLKEIAKAQLAYDKQYDKLWSIDPEKDKNGKKAEAAQKKLDKLGNKLDALTNKRDDLEANATANNVVAYSKVYDQYMKLYNKRDQLQEKGKDLSAKDTAKMESLFDQMVEMGSQRDNAIKVLENQIGIADGSKKDSTEAEKLQKQIQNIGDGVKNSATYQNLEKDIDAVQAKIDKFWDTHDNATNAQQKQLDQWEAQLETYYEKQKQLEENATADTVGEYAKIYDAWRKLQDKLDAGKVLSTADFKKYNQYNEQLEQFAEERASIVESLENQLEKALNPGDKITNINREYEEAAEGIYKSYQDQIDNIDAKLKASKQYQDLLAKKQNLESIRETKGLSAAQEKSLKKYTEELEALEQGGTGDNISNYIKAWEQFYKLQQKMESGKKLSSKEAASYDSLKSQLEAWNREKQTQISDLIDLMNDDLEKLREKNAENIADAEAEINSYYSKVYALAKQIAEYNINALKEQLAYLDAYINYYKDLVSLYDQFSGDKLSKLLGDLDESAFNDQVKVYEKYLTTLQSKYDATLSEINEYRQLIDAIDTNDFQASMDLFQKAMDNYKATGNTEMADRLQSVLDLLNERAVDADNWEEYADLWLNEWEQALAEAKSGLIETAGSIQEINDALREVRFSNITDALEELTRASNILSSMSNLIQDTWLYEGEGLSEYGKAKVALLVSQLENAQGAANEYLELLNRIQENEDTYASDKAYQDALAETAQNYYDSLSNAADIENTIVDIMKKAQEEEVSNWKEIIAARKSALQAKKDYYSYDKSIKDKTKSIESLRAELSALNEVNTAEDKARKAKLEAQLAEAEQDLQDTKMEHEYSISIDALDDWAKKLDESLDDSAKTVQESLESQQKIIEEAKELYQTATDSVNETMDKVVDFYSGMGTSAGSSGIIPDSHSGGISTAAVTPDLSINAVGSNKAVVEQSTGQITEQMKSSTQQLIDSLVNEHGEIVTSMGKLIPLETIDVDEEMFKMMSYRIAPELTELADSVQRIQNYQVNNNVQPVEINVHYDALLNVEGNVDEKAAKLLPKQLEQIYDDVTKRMYNDFTKLGLHVKGIGNRR